MKKNNAFSADAHQFVGDNRITAVRHCEGATAQHIVDDNRLKIVRHCEEQRDEAIHTSRNRIDCHTPLRSVRNDVKRVAFTLAEVLTTLVIIGIIAAITLPILQTSISGAILEKQQNVFERKFNQGLHAMQLKGDLAKSYNTTMEFVQALSKYMNITKICDKDHLNECFADKIMQNSRIVKFTTDPKIKDLATIGYLDKPETGDIQFSKDSEFVGVRFADGTNAIIAHDHSCIITDKYNPTADVSYCLALYYDVNGDEGPNVLNQDIITMNVGSRAIEICDLFEANQYYTILDCEKARKEGAPIKYCEYGVDRWAAAADHCFQMDPKGGNYRLPTRKELKDIATMLYGNPNIPISGGASGLTIQDKDLWKQLGESPAIFVSSEEEDGLNVYSRYFAEGETHTRKYYNNETIHRALGNSEFQAQYKPMAFCISDEPHCGK